ncbi:unnamed protein product [Owenia fusiformis]|uniref:Uncharacterized protein n=1 Tax=Owenia fusiformis TaxID=6347 RepID=A0A8J1TXY8_OWEFU|nr:unnamed protein product [Owenia fusiformis]
MSSLREKLREEGSIAPIESIKPMRHYERVVLSRPIKTPHIDDVPSSVDPLDKALTIELRAQQVFKIGTKGPNEAKLMLPADVVFKDNGHIIVADKCGLSIFDEAGELVKLCKRLKSIKRVCLTKDNKMAVTAYEDPAIKILTMEGRMITQFGEEDLVEPVALGTNSKNEFIITDKVKHKISIHDSEGALVKQVTSLDTVQQRDLSYYLAIDRNDRIILSDCKNHCVKIFNSNGDFMKKFGCYGRTKGQLRNPHGVCVDPHGNIIVADGGNHRVCKFTSDGQFISHVLLHEDLMGEPRSIAADGTGRLAVTSYGMASPPSIQMYQIYK